MTPERAYKVVVPSPSGSFEIGSKQGLIYDALIRSSVTGLLSRAKRVTVTMRWQDERGKSHRVKLGFDFEHIRLRDRFPPALAGLLIETLRERGFRTQYTISLFKERRSLGPLKHRISWHDWRKLKVAKNLEIIVTASLAPRTIKYKKPPGRHGSPNPGAAA